MAFLLKEVKVPQPFDLGVVNLVFACPFAWAKRLPVQISKEGIRFTHAEQAVGLRPFGRVGRGGPHRPPSRGNLCGSGNRGLDGHNLRYHGFTNRISVAKTTANTDRNTPIIAE
jgi:hypothetical protein